MIDRIKGTKIPSLPWKEFAHLQTFIYYDGPRLELLRPYGDQYEGKYVLKWWLDTDTQTTRLVYIQISEGTLVMMICSDINARKILEQPDDGYLYVVDQDNKTGVEKQILKTTIDALNKDSLPSPTVLLRLQMQI